MIKSIVCPLYHISKFIFPLLDVEIVVISYGQRGAIFIVKYCLNVARRSATKINRVYRKPPRVHAILG